MGGLARGVEGRLSAVFDAKGRARVETASPLELRGPFRKDGASSFYLRNITAGIFTGDRYEVAVTAEAGAQVQVASSSAAKVYAMPEGEARSQTRLVALSGSRLVWGPHPAILQQGAAFEQTTAVTLHEGGVVVLAEILALGRLARGESTAFRRFESALLVQDADGRALYEERYVLGENFDSDPPSLQAERGLGGEVSDDLGFSLAGHGVVVSVYALGINANKGVELEQCRAFNDEAFAGWSSLPNGAGVVVRMLADSLSAGTSFAEHCLAVLLRDDTDDRDRESTGEGRSRELEGDCRQGVSLASRRALRR